MASLLGMCTVYQFIPLCSLQPVSVLVGVVPCGWKLSNVILIFKASDTALVSNYRPVSLLSLVSKVLERIIHDSMMAHVEERGLLSNSQFGFRRGSSTQEAILSTTLDWHYGHLRKGGVWPVCVLISRKRLILCHTH